MEPKLSRLLPKTCAVLGISFLLIVAVVCVAVLLDYLFGSPKGHRARIVIAWTPSSSAPEDLEYAERMRKFLETNGGCELPCWLGMRAGETSLQSIFEKYLAELGTTPTKMNDPGKPTPFYKILFFDSAHGLIVAQYIYGETEYDTGNGAITKFSAQVITRQRGADSYYAQVMKRFLLPGMLKDMGPPDQVWVEARTYSWDPYTGDPYYELILYYFEHGMWVEYQGDLIESGSQLLLCPSKGVSLSIEQWWPTERLSAETLIATPPVFDVPLEQATGIDVATFYELFKDPDAQVCLETPTEMWK